jgi:Fe-S cluster assembly ATP-binding protein
MVSIAARGREVDTENLASRLDLGGFLDREANVGFSGGEIKRSELLQLLAQSPDIVLLDEPESGVDLENVRLVGAVINELLEKDVHKQRSKAGLIITHTGHILDYVDADRGCVLLDRRIVCSANPRDILKGIQTLGYEECVTCTRRVETPA